MQEILVDENKGKKIEWKVRKVKAEKLVESYSRAGLHSKAQRVETCASILEFKQFPDGEKKLHRANFCHVRLCPICAWRRSLKIFGQVSKVMNYITGLNEYRYVFLTLTAKNVEADALVDELDAYYRAFNLLTKRKEFKRMSKGWFRALEITYNQKRNDYHPHFHVVIAVNKSYFKEKGVYLSHDKWMELWRDCMGLDYDPSVDIRTVRSKTGKAGTGRDYSKVVAEVAKYAVKGGSYLDDETVVETLDTALTDRRLIAYGGEFRRVHKLLNLDDAVDGNLIHTGDEDEIRDDLGYIVVRYDWNIGIGEYIKK